MAKGAADNHLDKDSSLLTVVPVVRYADEKTPNCCQTCVRTADECCPHYVLSDGELPECCPATRAACATRDFLVLMLCPCILDLVYNPVAWCCHGCQ